MTAAAEANFVATRPTPRRPRNVVIASINRAEGDTGVHTHARMLEAGLRDAGVGVDVISPFTGSRKWLPLFAIRPLVLTKFNKTWGTLWHRYFHAAALRENLARRMKAGGVDVIVAQCPVSARAAMDVVKRRVPVAMVCHFNGSEAAEYRDKGELDDPRRFDEMLKFEERVLREVDRVIYVSNWARENVESARKLRTRSSAVIWNGASAAPSDALSRERLDLRDDDLVLINVGSIEPRKNQIGLIDLFAAIRGTHTNAKLLLVGDGPQRWAVEQKVEQLGLGGAVKFLGHRRDVPQILPVADLYVHYANLENCPLVLIEAARAGVPIAAIPTGGVGELQRALDCDFAIDPGDLRGTLERLQPLLSDKNIRREHGQRAKAAFEKTFTVGSMTQAYINALSFA